MDVIGAWVNKNVVSEMLSSNVESVPEWFGEQTVVRMFAVYWLILLVGAFITYWVFAGGAYVVLFHLTKGLILSEERTAVKPGRIWEEIKVSHKAMPTLSAMISAMYCLHYAGYGRVYSNVEDYGWGYFFFSIAWFLVFTDFLIYWAHRFLHVQPLYKWFHALHHHFFEPTPFAAYAFHPIDGFVQGVPYHIFTFLFPFHTWLYLGMMVAVQFWTICIHDRLDLAGTGDSWRYIINGAQHHTLHHTHCKVNYGQYLTWNDRIFGTSLSTESSKTIAPVEDPLAHLDHQLGDKKKSN
jgi:Delta7-sterol 5-desaturase